MVFLPVPSANTGKLDADEVGDNVRTQAHCIFCQSFQQREDPMLIAHCIFRQSFQQREEDQMLMELGTMSGSKNRYGGLR